MNELEHLQRWKAEALPLLVQLDRCHDLLPEEAKARLGCSKADAVENYLRGLSEMRPRPWKRNEVTVVGEAATIVDEIAPWGPDQVNALLREIDRGTDEQPDGPPRSG